MSSGPLASSETGGSRLADARAKAELLTADTFVVVAACYVFARLIESGADPLLSGLMDTSTSALLTCVCVVALVSSIVLAVAPGGTSRLSAVAESVDARWAPGLAAFAMLAVVALGTDTQSADSAALVSTSRFLRDGNWYWLLESQEAPLPHLVYWPFHEVGVSYARLSVVPVVGTVLLLYWVGFQVLARTGSRLMSVAAVLAMAGLPTVVRQANRLTLYSWFVLAGCVGTLSIARWVMGRGSARSLVGGSMLIAVAVASHGAGLYFAVVAFSTLSLVRYRDDVRRWLTAMACVAVANLPWLIAHYWVSSTSRFLTPRDTWVLNRGHLLNINEFFWGLSVGSATDALSNHPSVFLAAMGGLALPLLALVVLGLRTLPGRERGFILAAGALLVVSLAATRSAGFPRYFFPIAPGLVVVAALGAHALIQRLPAFDRRHSGVAIFGLVAVFWSSLIVSIEAQAIDRARIEEAAEAAAFIGPTEATLGYRSMVLNTANTELRTFHHDLVHEEEYVALYGWEPETLRAVSEQRGVRWLLLTKPFARWESAYNDAWFEAEYETPTVYVEQVLAGDCVVYDGALLALFDLDDCYST